MGSFTPYENTKYLIIRRLSFHPPILAVNLFQDLPVHLFVFFVTIEIMANYSVHITVRTSAQEMIRDTRENRPEASLMINGLFKNGEKYAFATKAYCRFEEIELYGSKSSDILNSQFGSGNQPR